MSAARASLGHRRLVSVDRSLVDDRAHPVGAHERVAEGHLLGLLHEQADELVVDRSLDVDARVRGAFLAAEAEGAAHDPFGCLVEVGLARDDGRVLATHLDDARSGPRLRERVEQPHPDLVRAGEHDAVDARMILEGLADRVARAHHQVDRALREAGIDVGLQQVLGR